MGPLGVVALTALIARLGLAYPSLIAPSNYISYEEDPLFAMLRRKIERGEIEVEPDVFMDRSRFQIHHDVAWPPKPLAIQPLGQIAGVDTDLKGNPVIFHRAEKSWSSHSNPPLINGNTIAVLDKEDGRVLSSWGNNTFYVPHGITIDHRGNVWVTDTGLHQIMKFIPGSTAPALVLGERFKSGSDSTHFCRPTDVAVATNGYFFVSDGYCNNRVVKFDPNGKFVRQFTYSMDVVHGLTLIEERDAICAADRENGRVVCFRAGLRHSSGNDVNDATPDDNKPIAILPLAEPLGSVFAISNLGPSILAVRQPRRSNPEAPNGVVISFDKGNIIDTWQRDISNGAGSILMNPHDVVVSKDGKTVYVAEIGPNRLSKFNIKH